MKEFFIEEHLINGFSAGDFETNYNRFKAIEIQLNKHRKHGECNYKLLINHIIILLNVFGEIAYYGFDTLISEKNKDMLTAILVFMQRTPISAKHDCEFLKILENLG
jgi:hypothetical protein